jgi:hypothetical protein
MTTKAERAHLDRVARLGCALCNRLGYGESPAEIHHPRTGTGAGRKASHFDAIPLCPAHHRLGNDALHVRGRKAWERLHGVTELELLDETRNRIYGATR